MSVRFVQSVSFLFSLLSLAGFCNAANNEVTKDKATRDKVVKNTKKKVVHFHEHMHDGKKESPFKIKFSGYVRMDALFDSRQTFDTWRGLYFLYPEDRRLDFRCDDINGKSQFTIVPYTNLKTHVTGPEVWGAKSFVTLKADNAGKAGIYGLFRMQHAYLN